MSYDDDSATQVAMVYEQLDGMLAGYNSHREADLPALNFTQLLLLNLCMSQPCPFLLI